MHGSGADMVLIVPESKQDIKTGGVDYPLHGAALLPLHSDSKSVIAHFYPLWDDEPGVPRYPLPEGFRIAMPEMPDGVSHHGDGNGPALYYILAGDAAKVKFESKLHPLDRALMAYIRALPAKHPLIPYVCF